MLHRMPTRRQKAARQLAADLARWGPHIAKELRPRMTAVLADGEDLPDVAHLLDVLGRIAVHEAEHIEAIERRRSQEGSGLASTRRELRGKAEQELRNRVVWVRRQMRSTYGAEETNRMLGHHGRTPRALEDLQIMAEDMVTQLPLVDPPKMLPGSRSKPPDPAIWAEDLRPALKEFSRLRKAHEGHKSEQQIVVDEKRDAMAAFDRTYRKVIRLGELFLDFVGVKKANSLLRPQKGRPAEKIKAGSSGIA